ncbi:MAG: hypothetical protein ABW252_25840 [Polyangiales bacterium]
MRTTSLRALSLVCVVAVGCTSSGSDDAGAEPGAANAALTEKVGSLALVRLERVSQGEGAPTRVVANAKVARYVGIESDAVLKLLGASERDEEGCTVASRLDDFPLAPEARVELLSIGDISLRSSGFSQELSPRLFPDLATTASGWFYAGNAELQPAEPGEGDEYAIGAPGDQGVGRFELAVSAPSDVSALAIAGAGLAPSGALSRGRDAELRWEPEDLRDHVEVEIYAGSSVLTCTMRDDGHFVLPQQKLAILESDPRASLVARRVRVVSADMQGIEAAYVRVAASRKLSLRVD